MQHTDWRSGLMGISESPGMMWSSRSMLMADGHELIKAADGSLKGLLLPFGKAAVTSHPFPGHGLSAHSIEKEADPAASWSDS